MNVSETEDTGQGLTWLPLRNKETGSQVRKMKSLPKLTAGHKETVLSTKDFSKKEQASYHVFQGHPSCFIRDRDTRSRLHVLSVCFPLLHLLDVFISIFSIRSPSWLSHFPWEIICLGHSYHLYTHCVYALHSETCHDLWLSSLLLDLYP